MSEVPVYSISTPNLAAEESDEANEETDSIEKPIIKNDQISRLYKTERNSSVPNFAQMNGIVVRSPSVNVQIDLDELANRDGDVIFSQEVFNFDNSSQPSRENSVYQILRNDTENELKENIKEKENTIINPPEKLRKSPTKKKEPKIPKIFNLYKVGTNAKSWNSKHNEKNKNERARRKSQIPTHLYETSLHRYPPPKISTNYLKRQRK